MRTVNEEARRARKIELMEKAYDCYAENGLTGVGIKTVAEACGCNSATLDPMELMHFIDEIPYWTAKKHGKKYRLMYQVYTHPKYIEHGKQFFKGVSRRYMEYAISLEAKLGIPCEVLTPLIFILIRASVHYAMFEDEYYLKSQLEVLKQSVVMFMEKYKGNMVKKAE